MRRILTPAMRLGLRVLQVVNREGLLSSREVSERLHTDARKTREVMIHLAKKGYLVAGRGCVGGYALGTAAQSADIVDYFRTFGIIFQADYSPMNTPDVDVETALYEAARVTLKEIIR